MLETATTQELRKRSDVALEKRLLAALALTPSAFFNTKGIITPEVFTTPETASLYNEITIGYEENRAMPKIPEGWEPIPENIAAAKKLFELWQLRQLTVLPEVLAQDLQKDDVSAEEVITHMQTEVNRVQALIRDQRSDKALSVSTLFSEVIKDIEQRRGEGFGLKMGLPRLDEMLGGLQPALHLMAGSPGLGKTTLAMQIAAGVVQQGYPAIYVTFDEVLWRLTLKAFCQAAVIPMKKYADGKYDDEEYAELKEAFEQHKEDLADLHLMEGSSRLEVANLESLARQTIRRHKTADQCFIIIDYLQRWASLKLREGEFGPIVARLVGEIREMAFRLNSPVMVISSLSRDGYDDPSIKDLQESGELEFSADTAMLIRENVIGTERMRRLDDSLSPRALRVNVAKNRYGALGEIPMMFDLQRGKIVEKS